MQFERNPAQRHVPALNNDDREAARRQAHREANKHSSFPKSVSLNGVTVPVYQHHELASLGQKTLSLRAMNLRELIDSSNSNFFAHYKHLTLRAHAGEDLLLQWFIDVQVTLTNSLGYNFTHASFGAPALESHREPFTSQFTPPPTMDRPAASRPAWSQEGLEDIPRQRAAAPAPAPYGTAEDTLQRMHRPAASRPVWSQEGLENIPRQQSAARKAPPWSQEGLEDCRPASKQKQAPQIQRERAPQGNTGDYNDESRFDEAARIRRQHHAGSISFG